MSLENIQELFQKVGISENRVKKVRISEDKSEIEPIYIFIFSKVIFLKDLVKKGEQNILICPATCRPYTIDKKTNKHWSDRANEIHGLGHSKIKVSYHKHFIDCVACYVHRYPTQTEFINYVHEKLKNKICVGTLPINIFEIVDALYSDYKNIMEDIEPLEFIRRTTYSQDPKIRFEIECEYDYNNLVDLSNFITLKIN